MFATTCCCSDPDCHLNGCKLNRRASATVQSPWVIPPELVGCICPPTSEKTCQREDCPRAAPVKDVQSGER